MFKPLHSFTPWFHWTLTCFLLPVVCDTFVLFHPPRCFISPVESRGQILCLWGPLQKSPVCSDMSVLTGLRRHCPPRGHTSALLVFWSHGCAGAWAKGCDCNIFTSHTHGSLYGLFEDTVSERGLRAILCELKKLILWHTVNTAPRPDWWWIKKDRQSPLPQNGS